MAIPILNFILLVVKLVVIAFFAHEGGHFIASCFFGKPITKWHWSKEEPFRVTWEYPPGLTKLQKSAIAKSGFMLEIFVGAFLNPIYTMIVAAHLFTYNTDSKANDFKYY